MSDLTESEVRDLVRIALDNLHGRPFMSIAESFDTLKEKGCAMLMPEAKEMGIAAIYITPKGADDLRIFMDARADEAMEKKRNT